MGRPYPTSANTSYTTGNCIILDLDGSTVAMAQTAYTLSKASGAVPIPVMWSGPGTGSSDLIAVNGTAVLNQDYLEPVPAPLVQAGGTSSAFSLPIVQNYIAEGNTTFDVLLAPLGGTTAAPGASRHRSPSSITRTMAMIEALRSRQRLHGIPLLCPRHRSVRRFHRRRRQDRSDPSESPAD